MGGPRHIGQHNRPRCYEKEWVMKVEIECPRCNGLGEVLGSTPNVRARYVGRDDLDPADFGEDCPKCAGTGTVDYDPDDEVEDWMRS